MEKKLERDEQHKMIAGVCAGLANYLGFDVTGVRAIFLLSLVLHGCGIIPYIILWIVMPKRTIYSYNAQGFNAGGGFNVPPQGANADYSVPNNPFANASAPKTKSSAGMIVGLALVTFGNFFLLDNFDLLPNWDFERLWPIIFVAMGVMLLFSRRKEQPWEKADWKTTQEAEPVTETKTEEDKTEDTPPAI